MYTNMVDTAYAHLEYGSIPDSVRVGAWVAIDSVIGRVGNTGYTYPPGGGHHLHFEVRYVNATGSCSGKVCWLQGERLTGAEIEPCCFYYNPALLVPY